MHNNDRHADIPDTNVYGAITFASTPEEEGGGEDIIVLLVALEDSAAVVVGCWTYATSFSSNRMAVLMGGGAR